MTLVISNTKLDQRILSYVCDCVEDCLASAIYRGCCQLDEVAAYLKESIEDVKISVERLVEDGAVVLHKETVYPTLTSLRTVAAFRGLDEKEAVEMLAGLRV